MHVNLRGPSGRIVLFPLVCLFSAAPLFAQDEASRDQPDPFAVTAPDPHSKHRRILRGEAAVADTTLSSKLRGKIDLHVAALKAKLPTSDTAYLLSIIPAEQEHTSQMRATLLSDQRAICQARQGMDAVALEQAFTEFIEKAERESNEYYRSILAAMSEEGRRALLSHIDQVLSSATVMKFDTRAFAQENPKLALSRVDSACAALERGGAKPPAVGVNGDSPVGTVIR